ncbi:MAG: type II toxin-antitoxin system VapB family antitoxin [Roseiarcus sp.]
MLPTQLILERRAVPLHIRDPRAAALARKLSAARGQTLTEAVIAALESELRRENEARPLSERLDAIARRLGEVGNPKRGHTPSKDELADL